MLKKLKQSGARKSRVRANSFIEETKAWVDGSSTEFSMSKMSLSRYPEHSLDCLGKDVLQRLEVLHLDTNYIVVLPTAIGKLTGLRKLNLEKNHLAALPEELFECTNLETLYLGHNKLSTLPETIRGCQHLKELDFKWNLLSEIPPQILALPCLEELNVSANRIHTLDEGIGTMGRLVSLWMDGNRIHNLPASINRLEHLEELDLMHNKLTEEGFPKGRFPLTGMRSLKLLNLGENQLQALPLCVCGLPALEVLRIHCNKIKVLPRELVQLEASLKTLWLKGNPIQIESIPYAIQEMKNLAELQVTSASQAGYRQSMAAVEAEEELDASKHSVASSIVSSEGDSFTKANRRRSRFADEDGSSPLGTRVSYYHVV